MTDLLNRANVNIAINTLLNDLQPNDAIQPSDHNGLLKDILDTLSNGLSTTLRTGNTTGGFAIDITDGDNIKYNKGGLYVGVLDSLTLTGSRSWDFPDNSGTIALLSDITAGNNLSTANLIQTDLIRNYTRSPLQGTSRINFVGQQLLGLESYGNLSMWSGTANNSVEAIRLSGGQSYSGIHFVDLASVVGGLTDGTVFLKGKFGTNIEAVVNVKDNIEFKLKPTKKIKFFTDNIEFINNNDSATYGRIISDVFVWGGASGSFFSPIGNEKFSIQVDTLIKGSNNAVGTSGFKVTDINNNSLLDVQNNGKINASSLPTSSAGLSSGDIWNNSGVLNIV